MSNLSAEAEQQDESKNLISKSSKSGLAAVNFRNLQWTRSDVYLGILRNLVIFGDAVELYLPGIITERVSKELGVSTTLEGFLGVTLYVCFAFASFVLPITRNKLDSKTALLVSLYTSVLATVFCSLVPNYWTLTISRALLGFCIGLNLTTSGVCFAENVSSNDMFYIIGLLGVFVTPVAGGWVACFGYMLLERMGWRYFIVCTSVPIFIPPIFILHCVPFNKASVDKEEQQIADEVEAEDDEVEVTGFRGRVIKGCLARFINHFQGLGSILLIPALLTSVNENHEDLTEDQQLLIQALLYGGAKLFGRILAIPLLKLVDFRILQPVLSTIMTLCYLTLIFQDQNVHVIVIAVGISNICFCVTNSELALMNYDKEFFGTRGLYQAAGLMVGFGSLGVAVASIVVMFLTSHVAVIVTAVLSCVQVITLASITNRYNKGSK